MYIVRSNHRRQPTSFQPSTTVLTAPEPSHASISRRRNTQTRIAAWCERVSAISVAIPRNDVEKADGAKAEARSLKPTCAGCSILPRNYFAKVAISLNLRSQEGTRSQAPARTALVRRNPGATSWDV